MPDCHGSCLLRAHVVSYSTSEKLTSLSAYPLTLAQSIGSRFASRSMWGKVQVQLCTVQSEAAELDALPGAAGKCVTAATGWLECDLLRQQSKNQVRDWCWVGKRCRCMWPQHRHAVANDGMPSALQWAFCRTNVAMFPLSHCKFM